MKTSQQGLDDIIYSEGEILHAYQDTLTHPDGTKYLDVPTIGCGHTSAAGPPEVVMGMTITHEQSRDILASDLGKVEGRVMMAFGKAPPQTVFDGAVSFDFNTGAILRATWPGLWLSGDMAAAERYFMEWNKPPEIVGRRKREADLIFRGRYHSAGTLPPQPAPPAAVPSEVDVLAYQTKLKGLGFYKGDLDGDRGPMTNVALQDFAISTLTKEGSPTP